MIFLASRTFLPAQRIPSAISIPLFWSLMSFWNVEQLYLKNGTGNATR